MNYKEFVTNELKIKNGFTNHTTENGTLPVEKWKGLEPTTPINGYELYNPDGGISITVPNGYLVIDIDSHGDYDQNPRVLQWLKAKNVKTTAIQTRNGLHLWFKRGKHDGRHTAKTFRLGYTGDMLTAGLIHIEKSSKEPFEVVYSNGIGKLPSQLEIIGKQAIGDTLKTGTARNDALRDFMNSLSLANQNSLIDAVKDTRTYVINNGNQAPLTDEELSETVLRRESVQYVLDNYLNNKLAEYEEETLFDDKGNVLWEHVVNRLMSNEDVYVSSKGEQIYLYKNGTYTMLKDIEIVPTVSEYVYGAIGSYNTSSNSDKLLRALKQKLYTEKRIVPLVEKQPAVFNGMTKNWETGELEPAEREDGAMFDFGYNYNPVRNNVLEDALDLIAEHDPIKLQQIKELFAWIIMTDNLGKAVVLQGGAGTGKSTIVKLLTHLTGTHGVANAEWNKLNTRAEMLASLADKRLSINEDMQESGLKDATIFKRLITREPVTARNLYENPFDFIFGGKMIATSNYTLSFKNGSDGVERRLFTLPINNRNIKHGSLNALYEEMKERPNNLRNGLLYVIEEAMPALMERGEFLQSEDVKRAVQETVIASDTVSAFLDWYTGTLDDYTLNIGLVPMTEAYSAYREFAMENATKALSTPTFTQRLAQRGQVVHRSTLSDEQLLEMSVSGNVKSFLSI